jgi:hypothetical protein
VDQATSTACLIVAHLQHSDAGSLTRIVESGLILFGYPLPPLGQSGVCARLWGSAAVGFERSPGAASGAGRVRLAEVPKPATATLNQNT